MELFIQVLNLNNFKRITVFGSLCFNFVIHDLKSYGMHLRLMFQIDFFAFRCKLVNVVHL